LREDAWHHVIDGDRSSNKPRTQPAPRFEFLSVERQRGEDRDGVAPMSSSIYNVIVSPANAAEMARGAKPAAKSAAAHALTLVASRSYHEACASWV